MVYLVDDEKGGDLRIYRSPSLTTPLREAFTKASVLGSIPLTLLLAVVNGFFESKRIPIRLVSVGDGK